MKLEQIPNDVKFEGYIWMSDENTPQVLMDESFDFNSLEQNPFVREALLWDKTNKVSYHILHTGEYQVNKHEVGNIVDDNLDLVEYLPHRLDGVKSCRFLRVWELENDPLCEDMEVLMLKKVVFVGFK